MEFGTAKTAGAAGPAGLDVIKDATTTSFARDVIEASRDTLVLVDFWAPWCGPCRAVAPILEELAGEYEGRLTIAKVNTDDEQRVAGSLGIMAIPTMIFFKDGKEINRIQGAAPKRILKEVFDKTLAS